MVASLARLPLEFSPGEAFNYSVSTDILGYVIGKLSGEPFEAFLKRRLFEPLGMVDTDFHVPPEKHARFAANYQPRPGGGMALFDDPAKSSYLKPPSLISGGGGAGFDRRRLSAIRQDAARRRGAERRALCQPKTLALMTANHLPGGRSLQDISTSMFSEVSYAGVGFGLGFR